MKPRIRSLFIKAMCLKELVGGLLFFGVGLNWFAFSKLLDALKYPDKNYDGVFTISDLGSHLFEIIFANGNTFLSWLATTGYGTFFEMAADDPNIFFAGLISLLGWSVLIWSIIYCTRIMPKEMEHEIER
jgi:hypothetical protein